MIVANSSGVQLSCLYAIVPTISRFQTVPISHVRDDDRMLRRLSTYYITDVYLYTYTRVVHVYHEVSPR